MAFSLTYRILVYFLALSLQIVLVMKKVLFIFIFILMGCFTPTQKQQIELNDNKKSVEELEAKITELDQQIGDNESSETDIQALKDELVLLISQLTTKAENDLKELNLKISKNQYNLEQLSKIQYQVSLDTFPIKPRELNLDQATIDSLSEKIETLRLAQNSMREEFEVALAAAENNWNKELAAKLLDSNRVVTEEIKEMILRELERLLLTKNEMDLNKDSSSVYATISYSRLEKRLTELESLKGHMQLTKDINKRTYAVCFEELASDNYCLNQATAIRRLGGEFINPLNYSRTKGGLLSYLAMSGVELPAMMNDIDSMIKPDDSNQATFENCNIEEENDIEHMIAPQAQWPRLVILALILEKAQKSIEALKQNNEISERINPVSYLVAWWRSPCYQKAISSSGGDHIYGSAVDLGFSDQANKETFEFYRNFIETHLWDNDSFGVVYPLQANDLKLRIGIGLGHGSHNKGKLHIGIFSEVKAKRGYRSQWPYGNYSDFL